MVSLQTFTAFCLAVLSCVAEERALRNSCSAEHPDGVCVDYTRESCPAGHYYSLSGCGFEEMCCYTKTAEKPVIPSVSQLPSCQSPYSQGHCLDSSKWTCPTDTWTYYAGCLDLEVCCFPKFPTQTTSTTAKPPTTPKPVDPPQTKPVFPGITTAPRCLFPYSDGYCIDGLKWRCPSGADIYGGSYCGNNNDICCFPDYIALSGPTCSTHQDGYCKDRHHVCPSTHYTSYSGCASQEACCYPKQTYQPPTTAAPRPTPTFVAPSSGTPSDFECGNPSVKPGIRIVGGENTVIEAHPWQIMIRSYGYHHCGGSLINARWVVTAAHCLRSVTNKDIVVGTTDNRRYSQSQVIPVQKFIVHPDYHNDGSDIALIKLSKDIDITDTRTRAVCLPESTDNFDDEICITSGWGATSEHGGSTNILQHVTAPVASRKTCLFYMGYLRGWRICAGHVAGGKDACFGDSGGPLVCKSSSGFWKLAGVVSSGQGCARKNKLGFYSDVAYFRKWIDRMISQN